MEGNLPVARKRGEVNLRVARRRDRVYRWRVIYRWRGRGGGGSGWRVIYGLSYPSRIEKQDFFFCLFQSGKGDQTVKARILPVKSLAAMVTAGGWGEGGGEREREREPTETHILLELRNGILFSF